MQASKVNVDALTYKLLIDAVIGDQKETGNFHHKNGNYHEAISCYSRALLNWDKRLKVYIKNTSIFPAIKTNQYPWDTILLVQKSILVNNRAECYRKLLKYDEALRDLNWIIQSSQKVYGFGVDWILMMVPQCTKAMYRRADIFLSLGNTGQSISDTLLLISEPLSFKPASLTFTKLSLMRHPSVNNLIQCDKYTYTQTLNKLSLNGWHKVTATHKQLPFKHGHSMIQHNGKIYCFGGSSIQYGQDLFITDSCGEHLFYEISITLQNNAYYYSWKKLHFPDKFKHKIMNASDDTNFTSWSKLVTMNKWNNKIILFGGYNPFKNVLMFDFVTNKWTIFNVKTCNLIYNDDINIPEMIKNHSAIIMKNKLYVFGGHEIDLLFCLDLLEGTWNELSDTNMNMNKTTINKQIPPHRFDHIMWSDKHKGTLGSIYIGFGSYYRKDLQIQMATPSFCRRDIWRYDVAENKWNVVMQYGNIPSYRTESGYTSINNGVILFGGYNGGMPSGYGKIINGKPEMIGQYIFFGDCFQFCRKNERWKMIQANIFPEHRALPGMCRMKDLIIVYGGYHGGHVNKEKMYNDLWILNISQCKTRNVKLKKCKQCDITMNECKLYLCKRCCSVRYCSKKCQKRQWVKHKEYCVL
eukprot:151798_1